MSDKPWTQQTLAEMRAFADAQSPPIDLGTAKRKADVHAIITKAMAERAVQPLVDKARETVVPEVVTVDPLHCVNCGVVHECLRCGGYRGNDETAHDEPLCPLCRAAVIDGDRTRADGRNADEIMDAWRQGETVDADAEDAMDKVREATGGALVRMPSHERWAQIESMSQTLYTSAIMRAKKINRADDMAIMLLAAHDLGVSVTAAIQGINIIDGRPSMSAQMMVALVRTAGYSIVPVVMTSERAVAKGTRGAETCEFEFTLAEADEAGLTGKDNWQHYPKAMLWARAVSGLCRVLFPDVLAGLTYTPEELGASVDAEGFVIDVESRVLAAPAPATDQATKAYVEGDELLYPKCEHDGTGVCCLNAIKSRIDALSPPVKAIMQEEWNAARDAGDLPAFKELCVKHQPIVKRILDAAETQEQQLAATRLDTLGAVEVAGLTAMVDDIADARVVNTTTGEISEPMMSRSESELAERAREIAREAATKGAQETGKCVNCARHAPLDEYGTCANCEPF